MSERNGLQVDKRYMERYGKSWMFVTTGPEGSPVAFEDWFHMIRVLCECEVEKYALKYGEDPNDPRQWARWTKLTREFIDRCFDQEASYEELRDEFRLPR